MAGLEEKEAGANTEKGRVRLALSAINTETEVSDITDEIYSMQEVYTRLAT